MLDERKIMTINDIYIYIDQANTESQIFLF